MGDIFSFKIITTQRRQQSQLKHSLTALDMVQTPVHQWSRAMVHMKVYTRSIHPKNGDVLSVTNADAGIIGQASWPNFEHHEYNTSINIKSWVMKP